MTAVSDRAFTGVDATTSAILQYDDGAHSVLTTSLEVAGPNRAVIVGTEARIEIDATFYAPTPFTLIGRDGTVRERFDQPRARVAACSTRPPRSCGACAPDSWRATSCRCDETLAIMETLDEIRRQIGLVYPGE